MLDDVVGNCDGFVGNRLLIPYGAEASLLLEEGVATVTSVDEALVKFGMPMGPLQMGDLAGLDIGYNIRKQRGWINEDGSPSELAKQGFKSPEQGCSTTLWAATATGLEGKPGVYCEDCNIAAPTAKDGPMARYFGVDAHACDDASAERLWELSEAWLQQA